MAEIKNLFDFEKYYETSLLFISIEEYKNPHDGNYLSVT